MTLVEPNGARREGFEPPTARSVAWCSASVWSAPDGSGLLTLGVSSIWSDPDGSRRIVWMIKRMIKPCDAAPSVAQTMADTVEGASDIPSGDSRQTGMRNCRGPEWRAADYKSTHRRLCSAEPALLAGGVRCVV
jgi:hypothetical protein